MNAQRAAQRNPPAFAPDWLAEELAANPTFVTEAIENDSELAAEQARVWIGAGDVVSASRIKLAVTAWIDHQWEFHNADAVHISNIWQSFDADRMAGERAAAIESELAR